jgi:hypothetical protein
MMNQIHREKEHLIQGNEKSDQHAKAALQGETNKNYKTVVENFKTG